MSVDQFLGRNELRRSGNLELAYGVGLVALIVGAYFIYHGVKDARERNYQLLSVLLVKKQPSARFFATRFPELSCSATRDDSDDNPFTGTSPVYSVDCTSPYDSRDGTISWLVQPDTNRVVYEGYATFSESERQIENEIERMGRDQPTASP
jgi:hypothetical protein